MFKSIDLSAAIATLALGALALTMHAAANAQDNAASPEILGFSSDRLERMDAAMQEQIDSGKYAAISLTIARHGKIVKNSRYGYQDLENRAPLDPDAIFRVASMTKPVTGAALMILYEEGKWQLDDPIAKFIPDFANLQVATQRGNVPLHHPITMREMLTSTAGFAGGNPINSSSPAVDKAYVDAKLNVGSLTDMIAKLSQIPLESQPGTKFRYGIQHDIQGYLVERISGQPFDRFLSERLFEPLGMDDTAFGVPVAKRTRLVPLYAYDKKMKLVRAANQGTFAPAVEVGATP